MFRVIRVFGIMAMPALFAVAAASAQTPPPAPTPAPAPAPTPAPAPAPDSALAAYEGEYLLVQGARQADLKIWIEEGSLRGQINDGDPSTLRPNGEHKFLHGTNANIWLIFTVENGKAVSVEVNMRGNLINGTRKQ